MSCGRQPTPATFQPPLRKVWPGRYQKSAVCLVLHSYGNLGVQAQHSPTWPSQRPWNGKPQLGVSLGREGAQSLSEATLPGIGSQHCLQLPPRTDVGLARSASPTPGWGPRQGCHQSFPRMCGDPGRWAERRQGGRLYPAALLFAACSPEGHHCPEKGEGSKPSRDAHPTLAEPAMPVPAGSFQGWW